MQLTNSLAENYISKLSSINDAALFEIYQQTLANHPKNNMLSSWVQGQFLSFISQLAKPQNILEIGTFTGFSALCLAKGLQLNGVLHTIELREEDAKTAQQFFDKASVKNIMLHTGNALQIIATLTQTWDLVFIDADKTNYINYYELILPNIKTGGWIIADNVLFHGQVLENEVVGKNAKAIHEFNEYVTNDKRVEQALLTVRDGLLLIKKL